MSLESQFFLSDFVLLNGQIVTIASSDFQMRVD